METCPEEGPCFITNYDLKPNTYSDTSFANDILDTLGLQETPLTIIADGAFSSEALKKILIDGVDIALADPAWLRRQIGVVLQENFLFSSTIRENITIHAPSTDMNQVVRVAKIAGAHEFILELPNGYDTMVGENGTGDNDIMMTVQ